MSTKLVEDYLESVGWDYHRLSAHSLRIWWQGTHRSVPICIRVDPEGFLAVAVVSGLKAPEEPEAASRFFRRLMEFNYRMMMAKYAIDDDLDVILAAEYPIATLDKSQIRDVISHLAHYADKHWDELGAEVAQGDDPC